MDEERRKHRRFLIEGMDITCKMLFATEASLLDISLGGASISVDKRLEMGSEYSLEIESNNDTIISLKGVVVWEQLADSFKNEKGESSPVYIAGIRFNNVFTGKGEELIEFIQDSLESSTQKTRIQGVRIKLVGGKTVLDFHRSYEIKKLSMNGMLIESDHPMEESRNLRMELAIPEEKLPIKVIGRVTSCVKLQVAAGQRYEIGIEFLSTRDKDGERLEEFIKMLEEL